MSDSEKPNILPEQQVRRNRRTLILILVISVAPIVLAYFSFFSGIGVPSSTASSGFIINPALNTDTLFEDEDKEFYRELLEDKKWHIFIPVTEHCSEECMNILLLTRQVHIRLGEKGHRLERVLVNLAKQTVDQRKLEFSQLHPRLRYVSVSATTWAHWIEKADLAFDQLSKPYYLLVDQEGFAMMYYSNHIAGGDLLKDLKRALKHSIDYQ